MPGLLRLAASLVLAASALAATAPPAPPARKAAHIPLQGQLDDFLVESFHQRLAEATRDTQPSLIVLELQTQPRAVGPALNVARAIERLHEQSIETAALVREPGSASDTLLALACDRLFATEKARLVPLAAAAFTPPASDADRRKLAEAMEAFSARRPRLRAFYQAMADPSMEVFLVAFEGREDQPAFYVGDAYRKLQAAPPSPIVRSERVAAPNAPPKLGAADLERLGLSSGTLKSGEEVAVRLGVSLTDVVTLGAKEPPAESPSAAPAAEGEEARPLLRAKPAGGRRVVFIPLDGMVGDGMLYSVRRRVSTAKGMDPALVVFEMNTLGGALFPALKIGDLIFGIKDFPTVAYVNPEAISAGALISVSCTEIVMSGSSLIGDSAVVSGESGEMLRSEKIDSYLRRRFENFCEGKYPTALAEAMVTVGTEVYEVETRDGKLEYFTANDYQNLLRSPERLRRYKDPRNAQKVIESGKLLTMNEKLARRFGFSSATVKSRQDLLALYGLADREIVTLEWTWSEQLVRWLDLVGPVFLTLGLLAIMLEFKMGGSGVFALIGIALIAVFFLGKYAAGLAEVWEIILFFAGLILLAIEVFVTPGFGVLGISGLLLMSVSVVLSLQGFAVPATPVEMADFRWSIAQVGMVALGVFLGAVLLGRYLHRAPYLGKMILAPLASSMAPTAVTESVSPPPSPAEEERRTHELVGKRGTARTTLRPAGQAEFDGEPLDVVTEGDFIAAGEPVEVAEVHGNRIVVRRAT
ncbi:MAG TPA: NfeD family protein [Planctomycetota bacterium]|nr:NfeD family protein [Planctomycetota bacterium]